MDSFAKFKNNEVLKRNSCSKIKYAFVTGGSGRIGSVFVKLLLENKCKVLIASRNENNFLKFKKTINLKLQKNLFWSKFDIQDLNQIKDFVKNNKEFLGKINLLVNNASSSYRGFRYNYNEQDIIKETSGLITGTIFLTEKLLPFLRRKKENKIINVASLWGINAPKEKTYLKLNIGPTPIICSSKAGLINYTKFLVEREKKYKLIVNTLSPGWFPRKSKVSNNKYIREIKKNIPLNRIGRLEDLISPINFLISDGSNYYNGQNLIIDGGYNIY